MSELYPLVLLVPDRLHWPYIHLIMCFVVERKELKARLVVTGKSGEREDICAIFREDLNAALVNEDTQLQLSIYRSYPGMAGAFELFHSEVRYLRAVYGEVSCRLCAGMLICIAVKSARANILIVRLFILISEFIAAIVSLSPLPCNPTVQAH